MELFTNRTAKLRQSGVASSRPPNHGRRFTREKVVIIKINIVCDVGVALKRVRRSSKNVISRNDIRPIAELLEPKTVLGRNRGYTSIVIKINPLNGQAGADIELERI